MWILCDRFGNTMLEVQKQFFINKNNNNSYIAFTVCQQPYEVGVIFYFFVGKETEAQKR